MKPIMDVKSAKSFPGLRNIFVREPSGGCLEVSLKHGAKTEVGKLLITVKLTTSSNTHCNACKINTQK